MNLAQRAAATQAVLDAWRERPFDWAGANCIRLARAQGVAMGHALPPVPLFRTPLGARRALAKRGAATVGGLLDAYFVRLPAPAFAIVGDLCALPGADEHGLEAICIADGLGNLLGWHESTGYARIETIKGAAAHVAASWRL